MLNLISLAIGVLTLIATAFAFLPLFGWANWFILPFAVVGLVLGVLSSSKSGRNLNIVVILIGVARLMISPII